MASLANVQAFFTGLDQQFDSNRKQKQEEDRQNKAAQDLADMQFAANQRMTEAERKTQAYIDAQDARTMAVNEAAYGLKNQSANLDLRQKTDDLNRTVATAGLDAKNAVLPEFLAAGAKKTANDVTQANATQDAITANPILTNKPLMAQVSSVVAMQPTPEAADALLATHGITAPAGMSVASKAQWLLDPVGFMAKEQNLQRTAATSAKDDAIANEQARTKAAEALAKAKVVSAYQNDPAPGQPPTLPAVAGARPPGLPQAAPLAPTPPQLKPNPIAAPVAAPMPAPAPVTAPAPATHDDHPLQQQADALSAEIARIKNTIPPMVASDGRMTKEGIAWRASTANKQYLDKIAQLEELRKHIAQPRIDAMKSRIGGQYGTIGGL